MKHIIFGGFDYAIYYEMDSDAIFQGIDYLVDNDQMLVGTTYLGKEIKHLDALKEEDKNNILILIGSIVYRAELTLQLKEMGFEEGKHFIWAIAFTGDDECPRLWRHVQWNDQLANAANLETCEKGEYNAARLKVVSKMIDWKKYKTLIDLGAANERIREFLPTDIHYIPVDYIRYSSETVLCDINQYEFPTEGYNPENTCILSIGNIGFCQDWQWYFESVAKSCICFVCGHDDFARVSREYRKKHWVRNNALFDHEIIRYMLNLGFDLKDALDFRLKTTCYKFEKRV